MTNETEVQADIEALNGMDLGGQQLTVNEARPRPQRGGYRDDYQSLRLFT